MCRRAGFTLLELLVVVAILAALVALALPFYQDYVNETKIATAQSDLNTFKKAIMVYDQLESIPFKCAAANGDFTGLIGKYLQDFRTSSDQKMPRDPWGNEYNFQNGWGCIESGGPDGVIVTNPGDMVPTGDDLKTWAKPPFFVSMKFNNLQSFDLIFSRKVAKVNSGGDPIDFATVLQNSDPICRSTNIRVLSDTLWHCEVNGGPAAPNTEYKAVLTGDGEVGQVESIDGISLGPVAAGDFVNPETGGDSNMAKATTPL
ncbi:MAG: prepilin-type N-terminal cleavage/methylation domain-containing protein [Candidatus Riflebacteria bacterium]|nr:prepilin-type N-terminal cleavage/methylation domain-containing protein [Candidatus Riflebacteria bacterium]